MAQLTDWPSARATAKRLLVKWDPRLLQTFE